MEQFRNTLIGQYYRNVDGVILVYDVTRRESFDHISEWHSEVRRHCCYKVDTLKMALVANQCDRRERQVATLEGARYAKRHHMLFLETSAKKLESLEKLDALLSRLGKEMLALREENSPTHSMSHLIRLGSGSVADDWVVVNTPSGPIPKSCYSHQDRHKRAQHLKSKCQC